MPSYILSSNHQGGHTVLLTARNESHKTYTWWSFLCLASVVNIALWAWVILTYQNTSSFSYVQSVLSGIYVAVCAFRSFYPRIDLERYCLHDHPLSSVALGRTCATIAEICFSIQLAIILYQLGLSLDSLLVTYVAYAIVPIIVLAQLFCWHAMLTLNHFWHGMEEFAWVVMLALLAACFAFGLFVFTGYQQALMLLGVVSCAICAWIMLFVDIPMYLTRRSQHQPEDLLDVKTGIKDALRRRVHTNDWGIWKKEVIWITGYFTFGVWLSIAMVVVEFQGA